MVIIKMVIKRVKKDKTKMVDHQKMMKINSEIGMEGTLLVVTHDLVAVTVLQAKTVDYPKLLVLIK